MHIKRHNDITRRALRQLLKWQLWDTNKTRKTDRTRIYTIHRTTIQDRPTRRNVFSKQQNPNIIQRSYPSKINVRIKPSPPTLNILQKLYRSRQISREFYNLHGRKLEKTQRTTQWKCWKTAWIIKTNPEKKLNLKRDNTYTTEAWKSRLLFPVYSPWLLN